MTLASAVVPAIMSRTKMSRPNVVSRLARSLDTLSNAMKRPSALIEGRLPCCAPMFAAAVPERFTLTSVLVPVNRSWRYTSVVLLPSLNTKSLASLANST